MALRRPPPPAAGPRLAPWPPGPVCSVLRTSAASVLTASLQGGWHYFKSEETGVRLRGFPKATEPRLDPGLAPMLGFACQPPSFLTSTASTLPMDWCVCFSRGALLSCVC